MGFTPEEAAKIPFGCCEAMLSVEQGRIREEIRKTRERLNLLNAELYLLNRVDSKSWELKRKYAKGELP